MKKNALLLSFLLYTAANAEPTLLLPEAAAPPSVEPPCHTHQTNFYAKIFSGPNFLQNTTIDGNHASYKTGYIVAGSVGYCWPYGLRLEGEYSFRKNGISKIDFVSQGSSKNGDFHSSSYMVNLSAWGCVFWNVKPFIGGGIGYDFQHMHSSNSRIVFSQKWNHFAWQVMAGLGFPIFRNAEITVEYRFHQGGHFFSHSVGAGLVYKFGFLK